MSFDPIDSLNHISEVITNRPKPIREFDQIYMRGGDMLLQAEHVSKLFQDKKILFIGDGDSIGLCLVYLHSRRIIERGPKHVHVLDFDERIVNSINAFAGRFGISDKISAECYNVANQLPEACWQSYDGFYTNPPFGESNGGNSIQAFLLRGIEGLKPNAVASVVIADDPKLSWTQDILYSTQTFMAKSGFFVSESLPAFHTYHLEDNPNLRSCSISFKRLTAEPSEYSSEKLPDSMLENFYGMNHPLMVERVIDNLVGDKMPSRDYTIVPL